MAFLDKLSDQINSQMFTGENSNTLDTVDDKGKVEKYGALGDFANQIDKSAVRKYLENGYLRRDPYNTDPKSFEILMQEPDATIFIRKRMFTSVAENFRPDFMDKDERLYLKAVKVLFQNKCRQIAALEALSKIQKITSTVGNIDTQLLPIIITLGDTITGGLDEGSNLMGLIQEKPVFSQSVTAFSKTIDKLRRISSFNTPNNLTTWITDESNFFRPSFGTGTGTIEVTNFVNFRTTTTNSIKNPGNASFTINDPYQVMVISDFDIERALADAINMFSNSKMFQFGKTASGEIIENTKKRLNQYRAIRGVSPISFHINPDNIYGKRVFAIIDSMGLEIKFVYDSDAGVGIPGVGGFVPDKSVIVPPEFLVNGEVAGINGLDNKELKEFQSLIAAIYDKMQLEENSRNAFQTSNNLTNYARKKMRLNFSGQTIIQPYDVLNIYLSSKSRYDNNLTTGIDNMFDGLGILQNLNSTTEDAKRSLGVFFNQSDASVYLEKSVYVGAEFPNYLWTLLRSHFVNEKGGSHVFGGVVKQIKDNWVEGKYTLDVSAQDNSYYFEQGKVAFNPGVDNFNGEFFNPLTPFKMNFDQVYGNFSEDRLQLLDENKDLLGGGAGNGNDQHKKSIVKAKIGPFPGAKITLDNYIQDKSIDPTTGLVTKVFYAPDGLVYKWKEGIGVFTQYGSSLYINDPSKVGNPNTYVEPFAGQDIMNVISLLITGQPYNYYNYWRATANLYGITSDSNSSSTMTYLDSITNDLSKRNALWGNFIPFKSLVVDEKTYSDALKAKASITAADFQLNSNLKKLDDLRISLVMQKINPADPNSLSELKDYQGEYEQKIKNITETINTSLTAIQQQQSKINNTLTTDYGLFLEDSKFNSSQSDLSKKYVRRKLNYLTRRMSYNIRINDDKNLFIVDDTYDKDYDIVAFNSNLVDGIKLFNNNFLTVKDKIEVASNLLNLEVYCDTQGHIRARSPQYNKMPSSVFYRMMQLKNNLNIQIFPDFLSQFFGNQYETLKTRLEILEDQIRLDCAILGYNDDKSAVSFLIQSNSATSNKGDTFDFISNGDTGEMYNFNRLFAFANTEQRDNANDQSLWSNLKKTGAKIVNDVKDLGKSFKNTPNQINLELDKISKQSKSTKKLFTTVERSLLLLKFFGKIQNQEGVPTLSILNFDYKTGSGEEIVNARVNALVERIYIKSGQRINSKDYIRYAGAQVLSSSSKIPVIDFIKVTKELSDKISERQKVLSLLYKVLSNAKEIKSLDDDPSVTNKLTFPNLFGNENVPEMFEHLIEDESYDDYGPGSGKRYIIKNSQIKSINFNYSSPPYNMVEVKGVLNNFNPDALPSGLNGAFPSGNGLVTALAVDYDMWRNFGLSQSQPVEAPFLSDPVSQCAPYAAMLLSRNRKNIITANVTLVGNEYMQPGEVVFLEDRGLLFYVKSVSHSFSFGSAFTTTLELEYGHTPGEYIPTPLDIIGKMIYNNREIAGYQVHRSSSSINEMSLGAFLRNEKKTAQENAKFYRKEVDNILYATYSKIQNFQAIGTDVTAKIELRIYSDSDTPNSDMSNLAAAIKDELTKDNNPDTSSPENLKPNKVNSSQVSIETVNINNLNDNRSPSQLALSRCREALDKNGSSEQSNNDKLRKTLYGYILDCWIVFKNNATSQKKTGS